MTPSEFAIGEVLLGELRQKGFFEPFVKEVQQWAIERSKSTNRPYIECLREVIEEEMAQMQYAIIHDEDHVELLDKPVVN